MAVQHLLDDGLDHRGRDRRGDGDSPGPSRAHVAGGGARRGEDPVEVDLDDRVPALVAVALEHAVGGPRLPAAVREGDEAGAGIEPSVGEYDIEPALHRCRFVDHAIQRGSVSHVRDRNRRPTRRMTWFAVFLLASSRVGCWPW